MFTFGANVFYDMYLFVQIVLREILRKYLYNWLLGFECITL